MFVFPPDAYIGNKALYRSLPPASSEAVIGTVLINRRSSSDPLLGGGRATLGSMDRENDMSDIKELRPKTIAGIKRLAKRLQSNSTLTRSSALDAASMQAGFQNFAHANHVIDQAQAPSATVQSQPISQREAYRARSRAEWVERINSVPGASGSASLSWDSLPDMARVLDAFMGYGQNHCHFPTGGGHDLNGVRLSRSEPGCLEFRVTNRLVYIGRPVRLRLERIEAEPAESYLYIEQMELPESGVYLTDEDDDTPRRICDHEELVDLGGGEYAERGAWDRGFTYDPEDPLPDSARLVNRILRGDLMLVGKASVWNGSGQTYNGLHNKLGSAGVRQLIENGLARRAA